MGAGLPMDRKRGSEVTEDIKGVFNYPSHYALPDGTDSMDVLEKILTREEFKGFLKANIFKYLIRYEKKGGIEDLYKAEDYLLRLIKLEVEE